MPPATLHLLCGSTGAGKTTRAATLAATDGAVVFSIDRWMRALFWMDSPQPPDPDWAIARVDRCAALIWRTACDVARTGTPCVLEIGLTTRVSRDRTLARARADKVPVRLVVLDIPADERWRRVEARNRTGGELDFAVTRAMFDFVETMWEPPSAAEIADWNG